MNHKHYRRMLSDSLLEDSNLEKGLKGDWQKEGYRLEHAIDKHGFHNITAYDSKSNPVGYANFSFDYVPNELETGLVANNLQGWDVYVHPNHQRKGLASAMYKLAEEKSGKKIVQGGVTDEGKAFWSQPNKSFGKEELDKGAKGDWQKEGYTISHKEGKDWGGPFWHVYAHDKNGNEVGHVEFREVGNSLEGQDVGVSLNHQRKGLATAMYQHIQKVTDRALVPSQSQTTDGKKFWSKSKKLFNKQELDKLSKGFADIYELLVKARKNIVYVSTDGDDIGASVERAAMSNDLKEIKKQDKIIKKGNQVIRNWIKKRKGVVYIDGGDDISFTINKRHLNDLEDMRKQYHDATGYTLTVGVGDSISEAAHAMVYGKLKGKNQINKWSPEIESIVSQHDEKPEEKYTKEGLLTKE